MGLRHVGQSWKPIFIVLRPNLLSIYRDKSESKLRHQIRLSDLTAVARQKDPKRRDKHIFGLFSPSKNYHLEARSEREAQEWVELVRREARIDEVEEEIYLASPGGARSAYHGFERSIDAHVSPLHDEHGGYSSSDAEVISPIPSHHALPKQRERGNTGTTNYSARRPSQIEYSGAEHGSYSDFSDSAGPAARMSALSLSYTDAGRPSTSSTQPTQMHSIYGQTPSRPPIGPRNPSQLSNLGATTSTTPSPQQQDSERVVTQGWTYLLRTKSGVRSWKKVWMVLRPKALALYKNEEEYTAMLILPFHTIIDVVEIDPISRSKTSCAQVISEERNYRFCAPDEESLARWLGAFKSLLSKRRASQAAKEASGQAAVAVQPPPQAIP